MRRLLLVLLALSLGCISESSPARDYGVVIRAFEPDLSEVKTGNDLNVRLQVENAGDFDAENVKAWIFNCGDFTNCGSTMNFQTLSKADLKASLPGEGKDAVWAIRSDKLLSENERLVQDVGVKVAYDYYSSAVAEIPVVSEDRYKELERLGKLSSSRVESSFSPVSVKITAPGIVVGSEQFTVKVDLEKTSDGFVEGCGGTAGCIDSVKIVPGPGISKVSGGCNDATNFNLWRSGSASMTCVLKADASCGSECHPTVKVTAKYRFVVERSASVTIIGTGAAVPAGPAPTPTPTPAPTPAPGTPTGAEGFSFSPTTAKVGEPITVTGSGYAHDSDVSIYLEGAMLYDNDYGIKEADTVKKFAATPLPGFSSGAVAGSVKTDSTGAFQATVKLPFDSVPGNLYIYALMEGICPTKDYIDDIKKPVVLQQVAYIDYVNPASLKMGDTATVKGMGFGANEDNIKVYLARPGRIQKPVATHTLLQMTPTASGLAGSAPGSLKASASGYIEGTFTLQSGFSSMDYSIYAFGDQLGSAYTKDQALNGRKVIFVESGMVQPDYDKDGVVDINDKCPNTPISIPVDLKGCPLIFISMLGSGTCDYQVNGQANIVARIKNTAGSAIYGVSGIVRDSAAPGVNYPSTCFGKTFEPGEEFDAKASITSLAQDERHKITAIIYTGSSPSNEINRTEGLEFEVPSNDCPRVKVLSTTLDKQEYRLSDPVNINIVVENQGEIDVAKLNVSVTWLGLPEKTVFERDECITPLAKHAKYTCSLTGTGLSRVGDYRAAVDVKEIREPAEIPLLTTEEYVLLTKKP